MLYTKRTIVSIAGGAPRGHMVEQLAAIRAEKIGAGMTNKLLVTTIKCNDNQSIIISKLFFAYHSETFIVFLDHNSILSS